MNSSDKPYERDKEPSDEPYEMDSYAPFYDAEMAVWSVKHLSSGLCYPMTGEPMAIEISNLLNKYDNNVHELLDELYVKDRKLEDLGVDIDA